APDKDGNWKVYIRVNDQNLLANTVLLSVWRKQKRKKGITIRYTDKEKILLDYISEYGSITLSKFRKVAGISRKVAEKVLVDLISLDIIKMEITEKAVFYSANPHWKEEKEVG
ncbi:MAG: PCI domain-containing protein, partial [Bacteroidales bacterium]